MKSDLRRDQLVQITRSQEPELLRVPGLLQKYYLADANDGTLAAALLWSSPEAAKGYVGSEAYARRTAAYQFKSEPTIATYGIVDTLRRDELPAPHSKGVIVLVTNLRFGISLEAAKRTKDARKSQYEEVPGLVQKYYMRDRRTGAAAGLLIFASAEDAEAYRKSPLGRSVESAYKLVQPPELRVLQIGARLRSSRSRGGGS